MDKKQVKVDKKQVKVDTEQVKADTSSSQLKHRLELMFSLSGDDLLQSSLYTAGASAGTISTTLLLVPADNHERSKNRQAGA